MNHLIFSKIVVILLSPLCSKQTSNTIQGRAIEIFRVTFIVEP